MDEVPVTEGVRLDPQGVDPVPLCADCATVAAVVRHTGRESACGCGRIFVPRWSQEDDPSAAPSVAPLASARASWPAVLRDLAAARLYARQEAARVPGGPADATGLLGRLQGRAGGAARDASGSQVATLWAVLQREGADRARRGFVDALLRHCEETAPRAPDDAVDWDHARRCAERLRWLCARGEGRLLAAIATELGEGATWRDGARLAADVCAPPEMREAWSARAAEEGGLVGRPRRDVTRAPVEAEQIAWGEARLAVAVTTWIEGTGR